MGRSESRLRVTNYALLALFAAFSFWAVLFPLTNTDIWWHLAGGRYMVEHASFIRADPFSYAPEGAPWTNLHWLFQLFAYLVHSLSGVAGLVLAKALVFSASALLLLLTAYDRRTLPVSVALHAALVYCMRFLILVRPVVFSLLYLAAFVLVLERFRRRKDRRMLWLLPAVQVLWTNTQGLFPLGPLVVLSYLVGEAAAPWLSRRRFRFVAFESRLSGGELRTLLYFFLGTCAACLLSPYGLRGLALPALLYARIDPALAGVHSWNVSENVPSWFILETSPRGLAHLTWFGLVGLGSFIAARRRFPLPRLLLFGAFLYLALIAERNVSLYLFVLGPVTVANLNAALEEVTRPPQWQALLRRGKLSARLPRFVPRLRLAGMILAGAAFVALGAGVARSAARDPSRLGMAPFRYPVEAAELLREPFEGNVFNSVRYGGYLIWRLYPRKLVFIDGRLAIRSREAFRDYLRVLDEPRRFQGLEEGHGITRVVIPTAVFLRYLPLAKALYEDGDWALVCADGSCALFARGRAPGLDLFSARDVEEIARKLERRHSGNAYVEEAAKGNLAAFLLHLGSFELAAKLLESLPSAESRRYLARAYYFQGRVDEARALSEELLRERADDTNSLNLLGQISLDRGDPRRALDCFRAALKADPYNRCAVEAVKRVERGLLKEPGGGD